MSDNDIVLGIDLGTTTSESCVYVNDKIKVIKNEDGKTIIPSIVALDPKSKKIIVGHEADRIAEGNPKNVVSEVKRSMGKDTILDLGNMKMSPEEISAEILKYVKHYSEEFLGEKIQKAVITVPANFDHTQRQATLKAGGLAGLDVLRIINEPTAAALSYSTENMDSGEFQKIMIYDLGGGTFDVSVGEFKDGVLEILGGSGNNELGGKDFDRMIYNFLCEEFLKEHGIDLRENEETKFRLMKKAEQAKKSLSARDEVNISEPFIVAKEGKAIGMDIDLSREIFEKMISEKLEDTLKAVKNALKIPKIKKEEIDSVLLVGGSTRIPMVKKMVTQEMGQEPRFDIDPDLAVCQGAAIQGSIIQEGGGVIMDITNQSLGTAVTTQISGQWVQGLYDEVMPKNSPHLKEFCKQYRMIHDNQESVDIEIYQKAAESESMFVSDHTLLAKQTLDEIPPKLAGEESVSLTYMYNSNGTLEVKAVVDSTGKELKFDVEVDKVDSVVSNIHPESWEDSNIANEFKSTIKIAEKRLAEGGDHPELLEKLEALKQAIINENQTEASKLDDQVNDILFDMDDD